MVDVRKYQGSADDTDNAMVRGVNDKEKVEFALEKIQNICQDIFNSYGYSVDCNSEWLGPWINAINDLASDAKERLDNA